MEEPGQTSWAYWVSSGDWVCGRSKEKEKRLEGEGEAADATEDMEEEESWFLQHSYTEEYFTGWGITYDRHIIAYDTPTIAYMGHIAKILFYLRNIYY